MICKTIKLRDYYPQLNSEATLTMYIHDQNIEYRDGFKRPAMIVVPGGGYEFVSEREKEPVAARFFSEGFTTFALRYTINQKYPAPHLDLACAMDFVRKHGDEYFLDGNISLVGFSAGGHLVGSYGYLYKELAEKLSLNPSDIKPKMVILSYAVISMTINTHQGTKINITQEDPELIEKLSIENHVSSDYPPTFIWTLAADDLVPIENSIVMDKALTNANVLHKFILFDNLWHGISLGSFDTRWNYEPFSKDEFECKRWVDYAMQFYIEVVKQ